MADVRQLVLDLEAAAREAVGDVDLEAEQDNPPAKRRSSLWDGQQEVGAEECRRFNLSLSGIESHLLTAGPAEREAQPSKGYSIALAKPECCPHAAARQNSVSHYLFLVLIDDTPP